MVERHKLYHCRHHGARHLSEDGICLAPSCLWVSIRYWASRSPVVRKALAHVGELGLDDELLSEICRRLSGTAKVVGEKLVWWSARRVISRYQKQQGGVLDQGAWREGSEAYQRAIDTGVGDAYVDLGSGKGTFYSRCNSVTPEDIVSAREVLTHLVATYGEVWALRMAGSIDTVDLARGTQLEWELVPEAAERVREETREWMFRPRAPRRRSVPSEVLDAPGLGLEPPPTVEGGVAKRRKLVRRVEAEDPDGPVEVPDGPVGDAE